MEAQLPATCAMDAVLNPDVKTTLATEEPIVVAPYIYHQEEGTATCGNK